MDTGKESLEAEHCDSEPPKIKRLLESIGMNEKKLEQYRRLLRLIQRIIGASDAEFTLELARRQARAYMEIFQRFCESGAPIRTLEVRYGANKAPFLMATQKHADGVLRTFKFNRNFPKDTVLQIWRSGDKEFDEVPLIFLDLEEVTRKGESRNIEQYPNGQSLEVFIKRESNGFFNVEVSFDLGDGVDIGDEDPKSNPLLWLKTNYGYGVRAALMILLTALGANLWGNYLARDHTIESVCSQVTSVAEVAQQASAKQQASMFAAAKVEALKETALQKDGARQQVAQQQVAQQSPTPIIDGGNLGNVTVHFTSGDGTNSTQAATANAAADSAKAAHVSNKKPPAKEALAVDWEKQCETKLANVKRIYVDELKNEKLDEKTRQSIRSEFTKVLQAQGLDVSMDEKDRNEADTIIHLAYDPNQRNGGEMSAVLCDSEGAYIDHMEAGGVVGTNMSLMLTHASQRLGKLVAEAVQQAQHNVLGQGGE